MMKRAMVLFAGIAFFFCISAAASAARPDDINTRFGPLEITGDFSNVVEFKGQAVGPKTSGRVADADKFEIDKADILLFQDQDGTACPMMFFFVTVTSSGAKSTPEFGTCSDQIRTNRTGSTVTVSMPGYRGPMESAADKAKASHEWHVYIYSKGAVTENGKSVKERQR